MCLGPAPRDSRIAASARLSLRIATNNSTLIPTINRNAIALNGMTHHPFFELDWAELDASMVTIKYCQNKEMVPPASRAKPLLRKEFHCCGFLVTRPRGHEPW